MSSNKVEPFGKYLLFEKIAMGGMAEIFLAKSTGAQGIGKFVAIKRILPQYSSNEAFIKMFTDEAKICMNLSHSNIAKIHEFGFEGGRFFLAMELIEGKNLRQVLSRLGKENRQGFSVDQSVFLIKEVASGLDNAHRCLDSSNGKPLNIIHRDISPQNVMLSFEGEIKVVDFGIAKAENGEEETKAGTLKGKFSYMSPEQASGGSIDLRTDVYSLGILLWELLANKRLFASSNEMTTLKKIQEGKIPSISVINPKVPEQLERILNISLAKDPQNRYQTCAEFYKDLNRFLNRVYPDFSPQEFSVFIKSLYADEVLENRKKFIDYSKYSQGYDFSKNKKEDKTRLSNLNEVDDFFGSNEKRAQVSINKDSLQVQRTNHSYHKVTNTNTQTSRPTVSTIRTKKKPNLFSVENLAVIGLFMVAIALIASQFFTGTPTGKTVASIDQLSVVDNTFANAIDKHSLVITTNPSGAEIFINKKPTGLLTPGRVSVPANKEFKLELHKDGYINYKTNLLSRGNGSREQFTLQKLNLGLLNIYARSKNTVIYINKIKLKERVPILNYRIPAGKKIKIKAVNTFTNRYETKIVKIKPNETLKLEFNPKTPL